VLDPGDTLDLWSYRRRVEEIYARVRTVGGGDAHARWVADRNELFATHPQSALSQEKRRSFGGLDYYSYDPGLRFEVQVEPVEDGQLTIEHSGAGATRFRRFGRVGVPIEGTLAVFSLFWLEGYGGGVFLPFRDATAGTETYGGGRYLLDTAKGADLGSTGDGVVLDFNFAYHPSCVYDDTWSCPLAPVENRVDVRIEAGERLGAL
jgi:hypothetical protein